MLGWWSAVVCAEPVELRVMSFNILQDHGSPSGKVNAWIYRDGPNRRERAVQVIVDTSPDILGLQEAEENQVADLTGTNALNAYGFYGFGRDDAEGNGLHEGIFYLTNRFVRIDQGVFWLSETPDTPGTKYPGASQIRIAVWATLTDRYSGRACFVLSTHFDHMSTAAREYSAALIRERIGVMASNMPAIVTGDFNLFPSQDAYDILTTQETPGWVVLRDSLRVVVPTEGTHELTRHAFSGNTAGERVDYVFFSPAFAATEAGIVRTSYGGGRYPSDHYPVTATLTIEPERPVIGAFEPSPAGHVLQWESVLGMTYSVSVSEDLQSWFDAFPGEPPIVATGDTTRVAAPVAEEDNRFYRVGYSTSP